MNTHSKKRPWQSSFFSYIPPHKRRPVWMSVRSVLMIRHGRRAPLAVRAINLMTPPRVDVDRPIKVKIFNYGGGRYYVVPNRMRVGWIRQIKFRPLMEVFANDEFKLLNAALLRCNALKLADHQTITLWN